MMTLRRVTIVPIMHQGDHFAVLIWATEYDELVCYDNDEPGPCTWVRLHPRRLQRHLPLTHACDAGRRRVAHGASHWYHRRQPYEYHVRQARPVGLAHATPRSISSQTQSWTVSQMAEERGCYQNAASHCVAGGATILPTCRADRTWSDAQGPRASWYNSVRLEQDMLRAGRLELNLGRGVILYMYMDADHA